MNLLRLTTPSAVLDHWPLFREGHRTLRQMSNAMVSEDDYCKMITTLSAKEDDVYVGVAVDGERDICYGVAINSTPPYSDKRTFEIITYYHNPARRDATLFMKGEFETWCRAQGVHSYLITTRQSRRTSGGTDDCFTAKHYGFRKAYLAFERKL